MTAPYGTPPIPPSFPTQPPKNWWSRNWKWVVPVGCLVPLIVCGGLITAGAAFVFGTIKGSEPYKHAIAEAGSNSAVVAAVGTPMKPSYIVGGTINVSNNNGVSSGNADLTIPISGPKGAGVLHVVATEANNAWAYSTFTFQPSGGGTTVDLNTRP